LPACPLYLQVVSPGKRRRSTITVESLLELTGAHADLLVEEDLIERRLEVLQDELGPSAEAYDQAWYERALALLDEAGLSWCTWCRELKPATELEDAFETDFHSDHYDPVSFFRYLTWHRACQDCLTVKTFKPKRGSEWKAFKKKHGEPMFAPRDRRNSSPDDKTLDEIQTRFALPPRAKQLRDLPHEELRVHAATDYPPPGARIRPSALSSD
jgi:hypothetical protein